MPSSETSRYVVRRVDKLPETSAAFEDPNWSGAETLTISGFHPRSGSHKPVTQVRALHDGHALALIFRIEDRYVLARGTAYQSPTHKDSCVEFFVRPLPDCGYFNFEFNAIGTLLLWYIDRPRRPDGSFEHYVAVPADIARTIEVCASLTDPIRDEAPGPLVWSVAARIPLALFEAFTGPLGHLSGQTWPANFYKCADECSHPHWGYWADIGDRLDFHQPERFGEIAFE
jgi:Carbohydrate-binding family 9